MESDIVLCAAGRTELDEAAALVLARLVEAGGGKAVVLPHDAAIELSLPDLDTKRIKTVCLSYLDPESLPHARYFARRFRRRLGNDIRLIVALWGMERDAAQLENARAETRADRVVISLAAAIEAIGAADGEPLQAGLEPELSELARRITEAIARTA
jgi:hypothetical protein